MAARWPMWWSAPTLTARRQGTQSVTPGPTYLAQELSTIAIILEGNVVMDDIPTYPQAMCLLFGLIYALHLDYPKGMKNTFEFVQKIMLNIGEQKLSPKLQSLKNALLI